MRRYSIVFILVTTLMIASASASVAEVDGERSIPPTYQDLWSKDLRITKNPAEDTMPQVTVDSDQNVHMVWQRSGYWTKTFDNTGLPLSKEVFITPHVVRGYGNPDRYPLGPTVAIDSNANIHVVWDDGWQNCYYQKFDHDGNSLTQEIHLGNVDNTASHVPAVAVDPVNDYVHIVHEDYEYQCEDIVYDKLDNDGKVLVNEVSVSADVSSHCEHCTLTTDIYGYIHVGFGSPTGAWHRKVNQNGIVRGHSVNMLSVPPYMIPDLACTPNGEVHMVWTDDGLVRYTRLDNNGSKLDEDVVVSKNGVSPGPPRIAAAHEKNTVHIVWHDNRDGNSEVYYATMEEGSYDQTPENYRLTRDPASSINPRVALDPIDNVHVVWSDNRDGNSEIYYKVKYNFRMRLAPVDVSEIGFRFYWHPNDTKRMHFYIENLGSLTDDYRVTISYDDWAESDGWVIELDETDFDRVLGGSKVYFNLTLTAPPLAISGDYINVTINARSLSDKDVHASLSWRSFIIVTMDVTVVCAQPTKLMALWGDVQFDLSISNIGDVPDTYKIAYTLIPENTGWDVMVDVDTVTLDVDESTNITVLLSPPENVKANENGTVFVRVQSMTDASVWDGKKLMGIVDPTFHLEMEVLVPNKWVNPGDGVDFLINVRNVGNMQDKVTIFVTSTNPQPGWDAFLMEDTVFLAGGEEQIITLIVTAPADALAGIRQVIKVNTVSENYSSWDEVEVSALVNRVYGLDPTVDVSSILILPGEVAKYLITVRNTGNGIENIGLDSAIVPNGWGVTFELDETEVSSLALMAKEVKTIVTSVTTPFDAEAGTSPLRIILRDGSDHEYIIPVLTRIYQTFALDLSASVYRDEGGPRDYVAYRLTLLNEGNGEDTFALEHEDLPNPTWVAGFYDLYGTAINALTLDAGERKDMDLRVRVPEDADDTRSVDFIVRATSLNAETDDVKLMLEVRLPDLRILSVEYDPGKSRAHKTTQITLHLANIGVFKADNVTVVLLEGDEELGHKVVRRLNEGDNTSVTFSWIPKPGKHWLTYRVFTDEVAETDYDNNQLIQLKTVDDTPNGPDFPMWIVLSVLAIVVIILWSIWREQWAQRD